MRPGHRAKRQYRVGAVEDFGTETVGAADRKGKLCHALVAPRREPLSELATRPRDAPLIEGNKPRPSRQCREDQCRLTRPERRGGQALPHLELDYRDRRNDPRSIERLQLGNRTTAQPADGENAETD